jgi:WLM domain
MNNGKAAKNNNDEPAAAAAAAAAASFFTVLLSFQGQTFALDHVTTSTTATELFQRTRELLFPAATVNDKKKKNKSADDDDDDDTDVADDDDVVLKILYKGKQIVQQEEDNVDATPVFAAAPNKSAKLIVLASHKQTLETLNSKRSDPLLRGFDNERKAPVSSTASGNNSNPWHGISQQDRHYKFVRFEACTAQSFGHRYAGDSTPHAFVALAMLEKLANDPGIVAVMKSRQLVVNTLGEMDPIDDRIMQKKHQESHHGNSCLLGYNTNRGLRIDVRLRTFDLSSFLPYPQLVATLIHELSHNWCGEHDLLFWTNLGQMRIEYLIAHQALARRGILIHGTTTAQLAGLSVQQLQDIYQTVMEELQPEMGQHGLPAQIVAPAMQQCCRDLQAEQQQQQLAQVDGGGQRVRGLRGTTTTTTTTTGTTTAGGSLITQRELALAAAENRRQRGLVASMQEPAEPQKEKYQPKKDSNEKKNE